MAKLASSKMPVSFSGHAFEDHFAAAAAAAAALYRIELVTQVVGLGGPDKDVAKLSFWGKRPLKIQSPFNFMILTFVFKIAALLRLAVLVLEYFG